MSKAGNFTAYQRLKPINVDWGEVAKTGVDREDELYARKKAEEKARKEERDKIDYDTLEPVITGIDSLDKGLTLGIQEAATMQHEDYKQALNDPAFADSSDYKIRTKNLNNYSKNVAAFSEGFKTLAQDVIGKSKDGSLSQWDSDLLNTLNGGFTSEKVKFGVKPDGSVKATIAMTDPNEITDENPDGYVYDGDGKIRMVEVTPPQVFKGLGMFSVTEDVDIAKKAMEIGTKLGKDEKASVSGFTTKTWQSWDEKKETVREAIRGELGTPKRPTALAKRLWADDMGRSSRKLTEDDMKEIEDEYLSKIGVYYDEMNKEDVDMSTREKRNARAEKKQGEEIVPAITPDSDSGVPAVATVPGTNQRGYSVSFGDNTALKLEDTESTATFVKNLYFTEQGVYADKITGNKRTGDFVFKEGTNEVDVRASFEQGKGWTNKTSTSKLTDTELNNIAKDRNVVKPDGTPFKNAKELKDFLKRQFVEMGGDPNNKPQPATDGGELDDI